MKGCFEDMVEIISQHEEDYTNIARPEGHQLGSVPYGPQDHAVLGQGFKWQRELTVWDRRKTTAATKKH